MIITGSAGGLGFATAQALAAEGKQLILAVRSVERGLEARRRIRASVPEAQIAVLPLDLASLTSVREFAALTADQFGSWHTLINNAGVILHPARTLTAEGFELHFGVNHLGHFALTALLLPFAAPRARVVTVSSLAYRFGKLHFYDLRWDHGYTPFRAYAASKLANLLFARELQRRADFDALPLTSVAMHPGWAVRDLQRPGPAGIAERRIGQSQAEAAQSIVFAATDPTLTGGEFVGPATGLGLRGAPKVLTAPRIRSEQLLATRLWRISGQLTRIPW